MSKPAWEPPTLQRTLKKRAKKRNRTARRRPSKLSSGLQHHTINYPPGFDFKILTAKYNFMAIDRETALILSNYLFTFNVSMNDYCPRTSSKRLSFFSSSRTTKLPGASNASSLELALSNRRRDASNRCLKSALEDRRLLVPYASGLARGRISTFSGVMTAGERRIVGATMILVGGLLVPLVEAVAAVSAGEGAEEVSLVSSTSEVLDD